MNTTPTSERVQIGIFGRVNAGKSSVLNAITGQDTAVVSPQPGTTTDPVRKAMEILPLGPVMIYDTPGLSDETVLGGLREERTSQILRRTDIAIIVIDVREITNSKSNNHEYIRTLFSEINDRAVPYLVILNKAEGLSSEERESFEKMLSEDLSLPKENMVFFSCTEPLEDMDAKGLRERIAAMDITGRDFYRPRLVADLLEPTDTVILVIPIDTSAPKGRIILPQQQVIRDVLDAGCTVVATRPDELEQTLDGLRRVPGLVITDSQAFKQVNAIIPRVIPLTSFSILMSRYKGDLQGQSEGARTIDSLSEGARILISEGCTHHRQCGDIGTVKLPAWIGKYTGRVFDYTFTGGNSFPEDVSGYDLVIHCGGCTLPEQEMRWRLERAAKCGVPMTNYGTLIAYLNGILDRATEMFKKTEI